MVSIKQIRNIGICAHVDAGKTTLSEQLLAHAGAIRIKGSVDAGTTHTDLLPVERRRGISVKATCVSLEHQGVKINLIDTPGHVDFAAEVERSLWALDAAVLVISAVEGVQPQTKLLFQAMKEQGMPVLIFINKVDREGADPSRVLLEIHSGLSKKAVAVSESDSLYNRQHLQESICDEQEDLWERYVNDETISEEEWKQALMTLTKAGALYPVLTGSALKDQGVEAVLDGIVSWFPEPKERDPQSKLSGIIFAAKQDKALGRGVWVRLFGGRLESRMALPVMTGIDPLSGEPRVEERKISQIQNAEGTPVGAMEAGEIGVVYGLGDIPIGHILGDKRRLPRTMEVGQFCTPLITVQVIPEKPEEMQALREACQILSGEDPLLKVRYIRALNELHLQVMGTIQQEIIEEILQTRFHLKVTFSKPAVIYKETIRNSAEGYVAYLAPKPCWAIIRFKMEPGERGSGIVYESKTPGSVLQLRYQHQIEQALPLALKQGRLGWEVTDMRIILIDGNEHQWHTHPLDFIIATPMAIHDGLNHAGSTLLEPILEVQFYLPEESVGRIMSDIVVMRGEMLDSRSEGDKTVIKALIPVQTSMDYAQTLAAATKGRGGMSVRLHGYKECPVELGAISPRRSVDPLDTSKYILAARGAMEGSAFLAD